MSTTWTEEGRGTGTYTTDTITNSHLTDTDPHPQYATDTDLAGHTHPAPVVTKVVRVSHTFTISGDVFVASGELYRIPEFFLSAPTGQTVRLVGYRTFIRAGTSATTRLSVVNTNTGAGTTAVVVTGINGHDVTTTKTTVMLATPEPVLDSYSILLEVTAVTGSPKNMTFTVFLEYVV